MIKKGIEFNVDCVPPSLNKMLRMHWVDRKREQDGWDLRVWCCWQKLGKHVFLKPVKVIYTMKFPERRQRDLDNYIGGTKFITDALKRTFLTRDDAEWIKSIEVRFQTGESATVIQIEEV